MQQLAAAASHTLVNACMVSSAVSQVLCCFIDYIAVLLICLPTYTNGASNLAQWVCLFSSNSSTKGLHISRRLPLGRGSALVLPCLPPPAYISRFQIHCLQSILSSRDHSAETMNHVAFRPPSCLHITCETTSDYIAFIGSQCPHGLHITVQTT
jgi:hypothetical protein